MPDTSPPAVRAEAVRAALPGTPLMIVLDDDPTGTQTVRDLDVLTRWGADDVAWAIDRLGGPDDGSSAGFAVLTNTRSLDPDTAAARDREIVETCLRVAGERGRDVVFASRGDSTLRGHFPLETDVITAVLAEHGHTVDAVVLAPAYPGAGRITRDGVHYLVDGDRLTPVADGESARDATFGFRSSRLAEWVAECSAGAIPATDVVEIPLAEVRGGIGTVRLTAGRVAVLDAEVDDDLRAAVLGILDAERRGARFVYRIGPAFVGARLGQPTHPPLTDEELAAVVGPGHGLVVVGSHVGRTSRQLDRLLARRTPPGHVELDVPTVLDDDRAAEHVENVVDRAVAALDEGPVVLGTSRALVTGADDVASLEIARRVSTALTDATAGVVARRRPAYVVAKGGITSSDVATRSLRADRVRVRGSVLPGIVSLWEPITGPAAGLPLVIFAGNVGDDGALADVVDRMERAAR